MGVNDRDILDFLRSKEDGVCQLNDLWFLLREKPVITHDWVINDIENLEKEGLLTFDKNTGIISLLPKANRPVVPIAPNRRE